MARLSEDDLTRLGKACEGLAIRPEDLPERLRVAMESKIRAGKAPAAVIKEFDNKPLADKVSWWCQAMTTARAKCESRNAWVSFAAGVMVNALNNGIELAGESKQAPPPIPKHKYADRPWFYLYEAVSPTPRAIEDKCIAEMVWRCVHYKGTADLDTAKVILVEQGFEAAAEYVYRRYPARANG